MKKKVLVVDDEQSIVTLLKYNLQQAGYDVLTAMDGEEGLNLALTANPDVILLDLMLPKKDGMDVCKELRQQKVLTPILMLTAKDDEFDKVLGLELGADDYIVKPFLPKELLLRMEAILRRVYPEKSDVYLQHSSIDFGKGIVIKRDEMIPLTATEYKVLDTLNQHANRIVTIDLLCEAVWGDIFGYENSLMTHIRRIREKIEDNPSKPESLLTVSGFGYKLITKSRREVT